MWFPSLSGQRLAFHVFQYLRWEIGSRSFWMSNVCLQMSACRECSYIFLHPKAWTEQLNKHEHTCKWESCWTLERATVFFLSCSYAGFCLLYENKDSKFSYLQRYSLMAPPTYLVALLGSQQAFRGVSWCPVRRQDLYHQDGPRQPKVGSDCCHPLLSHQETVWTQRHGGDSCFGVPVTGQDAREW